MKKIITIFLFLIILFQANCYIARFSNEKNSKYLYSAKELKLMNLLEHYKTNENIDLELEVLHIIDDNNGIFNISKVFKMIKFHNGKKYVFIEKGKSHKIYIENINLKNYADNEFYKLENKVILWRIGNKKFNGIKYALYTFDINKAYEYLNNQLNKRIK